MLSKILKNFTLVLSLIFISSSFTSLPVYAEVKTDPCKVDLNTGKAGTTTNNLPGCKSNPLSIFGVTNADLTPEDGEGIKIALIVIKIAQFLLSAVIMITVIFLALAGFKMIRSSGDAKTFQQGLDSLKSTLIGLVLALLAFGIVSLVQRIFGIA